MTRKSTLRVEKNEDLDFNSLSRDRISKILGTLSNDKAFVFYEEIGKPTGDSATSISDFCNKINMVIARSLAFHLKRGDFENWVRESIGDVTLANQLCKLKKSKALFKKDSTLRGKLQATVKERITELQDQWHHTLTLPESVVS